jgi:hypothetical protein
MFGLELGLGPGSRAAGPRGWPRLFRAALCDALAVLAAVLAAYHSSLVWLRLAPTL